MTLRARRPHKYGAKACVIDGIRFASQKEGARYQALRLLEKAGEIHRLCLQPSFILAAPSPDRRELPIAIGQYKADFYYCRCPNSAKCKGLPQWSVVEDVKGFDTPMSKWKRKHVLAQYGVAVKLV